MEQDFNNAGNPFSSMLKGATSLNHLKAKTDTTVPLLFTALKAAEDEASAEEMANSFVTTLRAEMTRFSMTEREQYHVLSAISDRDNCPEILQDVCTNQADAIIEGSQQLREIQGDMAAEFLPKPKL